MINKSSILTAFVRSEVQRKGISLDRSISQNDNPNVKGKALDLICDFHVRWNSTFMMLGRVQEAHEILNNLTYSPQSHIGLTAKQIKKLRSLQINHLEWEFIRSLVDILAPFYFATKCLCGRNYPTLALSYWVTSKLFLHLTNKSPNSPLEDGLKKLLLEKFDIYFNKNVTREQRCAKLVSTDTQSTIYCI